MREGQSRTINLEVAEIQPAEAYAGEREEFVVRIAGPAVPAGGRIRFVLGGGRGNATDWAFPQADNPSAPEYVSVRGPATAELKLQIPPWDQTHLVAVDVLVGGGLGAGDVVELVLGDRSGGSPGSTPQTFTQPRRLIGVWFDFGDGQWVRAANPPSIRILGGPADRVRLFLPSTVRPQERFEGLIKVEDRHGNIASFYKGDLSLEPIGAEVQGPAAIRVAKDDHCLKGAGPFAVTQPAAYFRIHVSEPSHGTELLSNPVKVLSDDEPYRLFWGVIHGHTALSDGIGDPEDYFICMRDHNRLDFGALADHDHTWETTDEMWRRAQQVTAEFNEAGRFVTFLGYEWAKWRFNGDGDRCVYYLDDFQPMYRSDDGHYPRPWHLFRALHDNHRGRALVIPHHTAGGNPCDFSQHDPLHERLIEIYSVWGSSECSVHDGNPFPIRPNGLPEGGEVKVPLDAGERPEGFVQRALALGWRVGFTGGGDDHHGHPGDPTRTGPEPFRYRDGLLGVWAEELTRESIWEALWNRRTIASTGARIILWWDLDGHPLGSDIPVERADDLWQVRRIRIEIHGEQKIARVDILRNNEVVYSARPDKHDAVITWTDRENLTGLLLQPDPKRPPFAFYYVRVLQADGEMVWASPIWLTAPRR